MITDNVETTNPNTGSVQMVPLEGVGKAPKKSTKDSPPDQPPQSDRASPPDP
jgi:hypothetical protein